MPHLIGTAGHVDHGKTTLIKALTGIDADRLPEEKRRGMTIDVGYAYIDLPNAGRVSIVDVPGHERFLTNMLVGALGIDVALLCVASDESVMPQTVEHLQILELLPVERLIVAMTRADLADAETREIAQVEVEELLAKTRFGNAKTVLVSAVTGEGLEELRNELGKALAGTTQAPAPGSAWYLPVDRVFSAKGYGVVATGTLAEGDVRVGERAYLEPGHREVRVRGLQEHGESVDRSARGRRTAVNLSGVRLEEIERGMSLGAPGALFETLMIDAKLRWLEPPKHGERVRVSLGADEVIGRVFLNEHDADLAQLRLERATAAALNQPLIVRRYSPPRLLGGGRVVVPQAKARRKKEDPHIVESKDIEAAIVEAVGDDPNGVTTEEICRRLGRTPQALGDVFEGLLREDRLRGFAGLWLTPEGYAQGAERFMAGLAESHQKTPSQSGIPRERVVQAAGLQWAGKPLDRVVADLAAQGRIAVSGTNVREVSFRPQLPPRQRQFLDRAIHELEKELINVPNPHELAKALVTPIQAVEEVLQLGVRAGELLQIDTQVFYTPAQLERLKDRIKEIVGTEPFAATSLRDTLETSRKYMIPLLEYLDAKGFTVRVGDSRVVRG